MHARTFRFDAFHTAVRKPRSPLLRVLFGVIGLVLLVLLLFFGLFVGVAMLAVGLVWRMLQRRAPRNVGPAHSHDDRIVDAEYRVIDRPELPAPR